MSYGVRLCRLQYILNRSITKNLEGITQEECCYGVKPSLSNPNVFGSVTHKHVSD